MKKLRTILVSVAIMSVISLCLLFIVAVILAKAGTLAGDFVNLLTTIIACASAFLGAFFVSTRVKEQGAFYGLSAAAVFSLIMILVSLLVYHNSMSFASVWKIAAILLSGSLGGILGVNRKSKVKF
ncbi:TIGR04086 family membrane protein [Scatolibacter rhodanostii]|uniref:TIGR04086 family membrane protein n=1 Tax=Scatolibacter rhodanostii TaxID=2014781 RepID=UPI000C068BD2|nr:TIGR04086 family membrane protein [Scatolibacter rhodanostii]